MKPSESHLPEAEKWEQCAWQGKATPISLFLTTVSPSSVYDKVHWFNHHSHFYLTMSQLTYWHFTLLGQVFINIFHNAALFLIPKVIENEEWKFIEDNKTISLTERWSSIGKKRSVSNQTYLVLTSLIPLINNNLKSKGFPSLSAFLLFPSEVEHFAHYQEEEKPRFCLNIQITVKRLSNYLNSSRNCHELCISLTERDLLFF